jgi:hypothetical protein
MIVTRIITNIIFFIVFLAFTMLGTLFLKEYSITMIFKDAVSSAIALSLVDWLIGAGRSYRELKQVIGSVLGVKNPTVKENKRPGPIGYFNKKSENSVKDAD